MTTLEWCSLDFALSPKFTTMPPGQTQQHLALLFCGDAAGNVPVFCLSVNQESAPARASPAGSSGQSPSVSFVDNSDVNSVNVGSLHPIALIGLDAPHEQPSPTEPASTPEAASIPPAANATAVSDSAPESSFDIVTDEVPARVQPFSGHSPIIQLHCAVEAHALLTPSTGCDGESDSASGSSSPSLLRSLHVELLLVVCSERAQHLVRLRVLLEEEPPEQPLDLNLNLYADETSGKATAAETETETQTPDPSAASRLDAVSSAGTLSDNESTATTKASILEASNRMRVSVVSVVRQRTLGKLPRDRYSTARYVPLKFYGF